MDMLQYMNPGMTQMKGSSILAFSKMAAETEGCVGLTIGEPNFTTPESIKAKVTEALEKDLTHYTDGNGYLALRQAISEFEEKRHNLHYSPDEIILTGGATEALFSTLAAILNPGDEVILPLPDFSMYDSTVRLHGGTCVYVDTSKSGFQLTKEDLEAAITDKTKAIILNTPNNPTGVLYTKETVQGIHDVLAGKPIFVICDEVYNQLLYTDDYVALASYEDMKEQIIVVQSFSKPYAMTGWRLGYLMAPEAVKRVIGVVHQHLIVCMPEFVQPACIEALKFDTKDMCATYKRRRDYVYDRLTGMGLDVVKPEGAFYIFPSVQKFGMKSFDFCTKMVKEGKFAALPGECFGTEGFMRISYCYSDEELKEGMDRLERFLKTL